jgi:hydroxymethylbilane synthase
MTRSGPIRTLRAGTRASSLARAQTRLVGSELARLTGTPHPSEHVVETQGDRDSSTPLPDLGGRGVFTEALERALLAGEIDYAVHSLKDVPIDSTPGLVLAAVGYRVDARDVLVSRAGSTLADLHRGARVGTCSVRRSAQLLLYRRDLKIAPLRGNVDTRVAKVRHGDYDAIVLAAAGLVRLGLADRGAHPIRFESMLPAPGQGALAVQCRADDSHTRGLLATLDDVVARETTDAERAFLEGLGGGCLAPIAARAVLANGALVIEGLVAAADGSRAVRVWRTAPPTRGRDTGLRLADDAAARGALELLA